MAIPTRLFIFLALAVCLALPLGGCKPMMVTVLVNGVATDGDTLTVQLDDGTLVFEMDVSNDGVIPGRVAVTDDDWEDLYHTSHMIVGTSQAAADLVEEDFLPVGTTWTWIDERFTIEGPPGALLIVTTSNPAIFQITAGGAGFAQPPRRGANVPGMQQWTPGRGFGR